MATATWIAIAILGPGSIAVFVWFVIDLRRHFASGSDPSVRDEQSR